MTNAPSKNSLPQHSHRLLKGNNIETSEGKQRANGEKRVAFSNLKVFEFLIQIGDNPSCEGAPLCISYELQKQYEHDVETFEAFRITKRRHRKHLALSPNKRSKM